MRSRQKWKGEKFGGRNNGVWVGKKMVCGDKTVNSGSNGRRDINRTLWLFVTNNSSARWFYGGLLFQELSLKFEGGASKGGLLNFWWRGFLIQRLDVDLEYRLLHCENVHFVAVIFEIVRENVILYFKRIYLI